jgi:hypothetical protein
LKTIIAAILVLSHKTVIATGGTDYHGFGDDEVMLGKTPVPGECVHKLKMLAGRH